MRSKQQCSDSGLCDHWPLRKGSIVGLRVCDNINREQSLSFSLLLLRPPFHRVPPFHRASFLPPSFFSITFSLLLLPLSLCDLPVHLGKQITAAWQELPYVSINSLSTQSARLTGPQQTSLFINEQQCLFTVCSFMVRLNQMDLTCLTD